jgi:NADH dehydrogenase
MNLVVGATGLLGGEIARRLAAAGKRVRALVRPTSDPRKLDALRNEGVELIEGDLKDRASLDVACQGAMSVVSTASATLSRQPGDSIDSVDRAGQINLVDAAKASGVRQFVYVSFRENPKLDFPLQSAKLAVERHLRDSALNYTILKASLFMEVWLTPALGFDPAAGRARIYGAGQNPISWVSYRDVAAFAVSALTNPKARNAVIEVGGPDPLTPLQVVKAFEDMTGRKFQVEHVSEEALRQQYISATDPMQKTFAALMLMYAMGDAIDMKKTLKDFPVQLTTVWDYARQAMRQAG